MISLAKNPYIRMTYQQLYRLTQLAPSNFVGAELKQKKFFNKFDFRSPPLSPCKKYPSSSRTISSKSSLTSLDFGMCLPDGFIHPFTPSTVAGLRIVDFILGVLYPPPSWLGISSGITPGVLRTTPSVRLENGSTKVSRAFNPGNFFFWVWL